MHFKLESTLRYANLGAIEPNLLAEQMRHVTSFQESTWCDYWDKLAIKHVDIAEKHTKNGESKLKEQELMKAMAYFTISAFPGTTLRRMAAYHQSKVVFKEILESKQLNIEYINIETSDEVVSGYLFVPHRSGDEGKSPLVIVSNGLEGTAPEIGIPLLQILDKNTHNVACFIMEMPGTYEYRKPMNLESIVLYEGVVDYFLTHPQIMPDSIGFVGISFAGNWAVRMAKLNPYIKCAVAIGAPLKHAFSVQHSVGVPEVIISAMKKVTGSHNLKSLRTNLEKLSFKHKSLYSSIKIPLLVVNGDSDTLVPTADSIDLAKQVPSATLKLYADDDHCAMGHYHESLLDVFGWLNIELSKK